MRNFLVTASIAAIAIAAPAAAQAPWSGSGELTDTDSRGAEQRRYDNHPLRLEAGQRYRISVNAEAFDPLAELYRDGQAEPVARDDDGGPGLNARIAYTPTENGDYVLRVTSFSDAGRGAYTAALELARPPAPPMQGAATGAGRIEEGDQIDDGSEGQVYDAYAIRLEAGQRYRIAVDSADFDAVARLYRPGQEEPVAQNDDGEGLNPRLSYAPPESGDYVLRIAAYGAAGRGGYTYRVARQPPLPAPLTFFSRMEATIWRVYTGAIAAADPSDDQNRHFDDYLVTFAAGQKRMIALESSAFDSYVQIFRAGERDGTALASDDDSGGGVNAMLIFTAEQAGDYVVRVSPLGASATGAYRLRVSE